MLAGGARGGRLPRSIGNYAVIGDCRSAALVSSGGSIDWLCWPRFDSPSIFGALLDAESGGFFAIRPSVPDFATERRYLDGTNVLVTRFTTTAGVVELLDTMPVATEAAKRAALRPSHWILRRIRCLSGSMPMTMLCCPSPRYGLGRARLRTRGKLGWHRGFADELLVLHSDVRPLPQERVSSHAAGRDGGPADDTHVCARFLLHEGQCHYATLSYAQRTPAVIPPTGSVLEQAIADSIDLWRAWTARCRYEGPFRDAVVRSALVLKLLTFSPSGAVVAAPTTSLPEWRGGSRNWDYRYCWLRDASMTLRVLFDLGYAEEAQSYLSWLLHTTRITWPELSVVYDVYGKPCEEEHELLHLKGFAGSKPVRVGNAAGRQTQLDVYGEVLDAVYGFAMRTGSIGRATARMVQGFAGTVLRRWQEADHGIWETRTVTRHHTTSKAMCWVALDRALKLARLGLIRVDRSRMSAAMDAIRSQIEREGFDEKVGSYVSELGGHCIDASVLLLARYGYLAASDPRMQRTIEAVLRELGTDGLVYRYRTDDGLPPGEGAFGICGFWSVAVQAQAGNIAHAEMHFRKLIAASNDVGLFAEEIDPDTCEALGNFPQAFTHVGLIDAALVLARAQEEAHSDAARCDAARRRTSREA